MLNLGYQQQAYKKVHVETANPGRILLTLYDAAIRFVTQGEEQIKAGDLGGKGVSLGRAHAIIAEFINALDHDSAPELCSNLELVYGFMLEKIAQANAEVSTEPLQPVIKHLKEMRDTWQEAVNNANVENAGRESAP